MFLPTLFEYESTYTNWYLPEQWINLEKSCDINLILKQQPSILGWSITYSNINGSYNFMSSHGYNPIQSLRNGLIF